MGSNERHVGVEPNTDSAFTDEGQPVVCCGDCNELHEDENGLYCGKLCVDVSEDMRTPCCYFIPVEPA